MIPIHRLMVILMHFGMLIELIKLYRDEKTTKIEYLNSLFINE